MKRRTSSAFTIVELLIVIIVIAILATITIVAYNGVKERTVISSLKSDLRNAANKLELGRVETSIYLSDKNALPRSEDTSYQYDYDNSVIPPTYCLTAISSKSNRAVYHISSEQSTPTEGPCATHHGPIIYTYDFTLTGGTSTSSSSVTAAFTWDKNTISGMQFQRYWLYESCNGPNAIISSSDPEFILNPNGSGTAYLSWGNLAGFGHGTTAALWVRARPVDANQNPLTDWSTAKGLTGKQGSWTACSPSQSPWTNPSTITTQIARATVANLGDQSSGTVMAQITHYAKTTAAGGVFSPSADTYWYVDNDYKIEYEKVVYMNSGCVGSTPLNPTRNSETGTSTFGPTDNNPLSTVQGVSLGSMRIGLAVTNPQIGAVWARARVVDSSNAVLSAWSEPYGVVTVYDLANSSNPVSLQVCDPLSPPPISHWPSER